MQESTPVFLQRIALQHSDRKLKEYIQNLELVAQKAKLVVAQSNGNEGIHELKEAVEKLEKVAS